MAIIRETRPAGPSFGTWRTLVADSPELGGDCAGCAGTFVEDDVVTSVLIGPGSDTAARIARDSWRRYSAVFVLAHQDCVG